MISKDYDRWVKSKLENQTQRVLYELWHAIVIKRRFCLSQTFDEWISGGGLPLQALRGAQNGGDAADVRLRSLDIVYGIPFVGSDINGRHHRYSIHQWRNISGKKTYYYRLDILPEDIDWDNLFISWPKWRYKPIKLF